MQKLMKPIYTLFFIAIIFILFASTTVFANSPPPASYFYIRLQNISSDIKYAQLLIQSDKSTSDFTVYKQMDVMYIEEDSSGSCDALILPGDRDSSLMMYTSKIKVAVLNADQKILKTSPAASVIPDGGGFYPSTVIFDVKNDKIEVGFAPFYNDSSPSNLFGSALNFIIILILAILFRMAVSTGLEILIALPFKIKPLWKIIVVNIITQLLLFSFITFSGVNYIPAVIIGEIFVFVSEYIAYILLFKRISKIRLAIYTVVANSVSLIVGLIFNFLHWFVA